MRLGSCPTIDDHITSCCRPANRQTERSRCRNSVIGDGEYTWIRASLTGPRGALRFRLVDPVDYSQIAPYVRPGIHVLVPVSPLPAGARITGSVTVRIGKRMLTRTWSFTTA